jgi:hypothetical protein
MLTFPPPAIKTVTVVPHNLEETAGRFRVWLFTGKTKADTEVASQNASLGASEPEGNNNPYGEGVQLVWDRKIEGGFPELKVLVSISFTVLGLRLRTDTPFSRTVLPFYFC